MKQLLIILTLALIPGWIIGQQQEAGLTATLKISNIHVELNGQAVEWDKTYEFVISDGVLFEAILFEQKDLKYGTQFTYKKGSNRLKLLRRGYVNQSGKKTSFGKKEKDMQVIRTSIPGNLKKRVVDNIILSKEMLEAINISFNYELIYK